MKQNVTAFQNSKFSSLWQKIPYPINADFPKYINFERVLDAIAVILENGPSSEIQQPSPADCDGVNHKIIANKNGRFSWRPLELIHPALYVKLVNVICEAGVGMKSQSVSAILKMVLFSAAVCQSLQTGPIATQQRRSRNGG